MGFRIKSLLLNLLPVFLKKEFDKLAKKLYYCKFLEQQQWVKSFATLQVGLWIKSVLLNLLPRFLKVECNQAGKNRFIFDVQQQ